MKVCLTGGGNVYALNLARALDSMGIEHFGIGRSPRKGPAFWQVDHDYRYYAMHLIRDFHAVMDLLDAERPDVVVNFAAQGESAASFGDRTDYFYATNALALVRFAEELRQRDYLRRFIQAGTSEVYGSARRASVETDPLQPTSPYAISKGAFDQHLQVMHRVHGFPMNVMRPSNAFCPGQQLHRVIPRAAICALSGQKMALHGGGRAAKSYMHATDLSRAIVAVLERGTVGAIYNCGPQSPTRIRFLVEAVAEACGIRLEDLISESPDRLGEDSCYWLDSSALTRATGWRPSIEIEDGIAEMVRWVKAHPELLTMDSTFRIAA